MTHRQNAYSRSDEPDDARNELAVLRDDARATLGERAFKVLDTKITEYLVRAKLTTDFVPMGDGHTELVESSSTPTAPVEVWRDWRAITTAFGLPEPASQSTNRSTRSTTSSIE